MLCRSGNLACFTYGRINLACNRLALGPGLFKSGSLDFFFSFLFYLQPSAVEDLRKWTSFEAIGDITVPPDCTVRLTGNGSVILGNVSQNASPSYQAGTSASFDETDDIIMVDSSSRGLGREQDTPLDHRLPSPEEQCQMIALK